MRRSPCALAGSSQVDPDRRRTSACQTVTIADEVLAEVDVAAWWPAAAPPAFEVLLPPNVDLVVLDSAPLELAGRIALHGQVLFDDDAPARIRWVSMTRKIHADERPRLERSHREFAESVLHG